MLLLIISYMMIGASCYIFSPWKFGYDSMFLPNAYYDDEMSECKEDIDCEAKYGEFSIYDDNINVT